MNEPSVSDLSRGPRGYSESGVEASSNGADHCSGAMSAIGHIN